jgi:hypothetical protein
VGPEGDSAEVKPETEVTSAEKVEKMEASVPGDGKASEAATKEAKVVVEPKPAAEG